MQAFRHPLEALGAGAIDQEVWIERHFFRFRVCNRLYVQNPFFDPKPSFGGVADHPREIAWGAILDAERRVVAAEELPIPNRFSGAIPQFRID
jgi:hypothetical protein